MANPTPQQNQNVAPQQNIDKDVMALVSGKPKKEESAEISQAKERLLKVMQTAQISPQTVIKAGQYAEQALKNPQMYPIAVQTAIREKLINPEDVQPGGIDYKLLANGITAAKMVQELMQEGRL